VKAKLFKDSLRLPNNKALWAKVTVRPELKRTTVLVRGIAIGSNFSIPKLGQTPPVNIEGIKLK